MLTFAFNRTFPSRCAIACLALAGLVLVWGCSERPSQAPTSAATDGPVTASTWPIASLAQAVLGDAIPVVCLPPEGADPEFWEPSETQLADLLKSRWILLNGAGFEAWASTANLPLNRTLNTGESFRSAWIEIKEAHQHSHGAQGAHTHVGHDPHFWMDPLLALEQARAIQAGALAESWLTATEAEKNLGTLDTQLRELDALWTQIAAQIGGRTLLANHGTYAYPAQRYGISIQVIDQDPEAAASPATLSALTLFTQTDVTANGHLMLFESDPVPALAAQLRDELSIEPIRLRPAETPVAGYTSALEIWREDLQNLLQTLNE